MENFLVRNFFIKNKKYIRTKGKHNLKNKYEPAQLEFVIGRRLYM